MKEKYRKLEDGEWYRQPQKDRVACCDCGLVHDVEWRPGFDDQGPIGLVTIEVRHVRNARATAQVRRAMIRKGEL